LLSISNTKLFKNGISSESFFPKSAFVIVISSLSIPLESSFNIQIQCWSKSSFIPSSSFEQIIPFELTHLITTGFILRSFTGKYAPGKATGTKISFLMLSAPVTI
jgi:hypothetical protein